jgi:hypothetical protein
MPMVRCPSCAVRQYAATPYVTPVECAECGGPLLQPRTGWIPGQRERAFAAGEVEDSTST